MAEKAEKKKTSDVLDSIGVNPLALPIELGVGTVGSEISVLITKRPSSCSSFDGALELLLVGSIGCVPSGQGQYSKGHALVAQSVAESGEHHAAYSSCHSP